MSKPRRASYALTSVELPVLTTLGLEEVDPEEVFELQRKEGAGAFGRVFRACYKSDRSRLVALKVIPVALEAGERGEDIESVRREIQFLRECDHPNVVAFHGAYYKDGALWVAMEHCAGGSVGDVRRVRALSEQEIAVIMREALCGLAYLHSRRKIHRDVKGGNILLTERGQVKIADFGVSAQLRDTLSRRGSFVGTPYWMSPELIQDSDYDFKADIWSLGITAIELADQKPPLFDEHPMRVLIQIPRNPPPQVAQPEKWSAAFMDFLRFCLRKDPAKRPSALECMQHEFIRREAHVERVFANVERRESLDVAIKPLKGNYSAGEQVEKEEFVAAVLTEAPTIELELEREIAKEIDTDVKSVAFVPTHETIEKTEPMLEQTATNDEIVILSTKHSAVDQDEEMRKQAKCRPSQHTMSFSRFIGQPPTELKLLPSSAKSPVIRGSASRESLTQLVELTATSLKRPLTPPTSVCRPKASLSPPSSVLSSGVLSVLTSQEDPLASIDTVTSTRVHRLLSSVSQSTCSTRYIDPLSRSRTRQSFNWRSVDAALPSPDSRSLPNDKKKKKHSTALEEKIYVGDPYHASHNVCVKYNSIQAQYEGVPVSAEWTTLHQQFGIALSHMRCRSLGTPLDDQVPALLRMLRRHLLRCQGQYCKYIYRLSPVQDELMRAKDAINRGSFDAAHVSDPHVFASLLKLWFRDLPTLLLSALDVPDISSITTFVTSKLVPGADQDDDVFHRIVVQAFTLVNEAITCTLQKLSAREHAVFLWLLDHLVEVTSHQVVNHMTIHALATVMAPNLYSCTGETRNGHETIMRQVVTFLRIMVAWRRVQVETLSASSSLYELEEKHDAEDASPSKNQASNLQERVRQSIANNKSPAFHQDMKLSLEAALCIRVDQLWSEVNPRKGLTFEPLRQDPVARSVFVEFQHSILQLIAKHSKRASDRLWANDCMKVPKDRVEAMPIPASLKRIKHWIEATRTFETFCRFLEQEETMQEKLEKLQRQLKDSGNPKQQAPRLSYLPTRWNQSNQREEKQTSELLVKGAMLLLCNGKAGNNEARASSLLHEELVQLGEEQGAIGNLLALYGHNSQDSNDSTKVNKIDHLEA